MLSLALQTSRTIAPPVPKQTQDAKVQSPAAMPSPLERPRRLRNKAPFAFERCKLTRAFGVGDCAPPPFPQTPKRMGLVRHAAPLALRGEWLSESLSVLRPTTPAHASRQQSAVTPSAAFHPPLVCCVCSASRESGEASRKTVLSCAHSARGLGRLDGAGFTCAGAMTMGICGCLPLAEYDVMVHRTDRRRGRGRGPFAQFPEDLLKEAVALVWNDQLKGLEEHAHSRGEIYPRMSFETAKENAAAKCDWKRHGFNFVSQRKPTAF